ncbi:MAG: hypothetical protein A2W05_03955 [Candidatus Schekmanbacteria bacterium RBG_16_38_10]|uniref:Uncharacterized protein n=1 Tax=Candidatus Schekmanbacteria bacterium RBG_16_38_10 TaxID=1817879 RepID=A0A1F7RWP4_9BACT|nr:MAG: hypothetical protein A2W05_03955 [Candidatus Schekmanbacteria bacterium RBG_16_38_10]
MNKLKRIGIIFIIIGAFIPSVLYPFASLTTSATLMQIFLGSKGAVYQPRLADMLATLFKGMWSILGQIALLTVLTFSIRIWGFYLLEKAESNINF